VSDLGWSLTNHWRFKDLIFIGSNDLERSPVIRVSPEIIAQNNQWHERNYRQKVPL